MFICINVATCNSYILVLSLNFKEFVIEQKNSLDYLHLSNISFVLLNFENSTYFFFNLKISLNWRLSLIFLQGLQDKFFLIISFLKFFLLFSFNFVTNCCWIVFKNPLMQKCDLENLTFCLGTFLHYAYAIPLNFSESDKICKNLFPKYCQFFTRSLSSANL